MPGGWGGRGKSISRRITSRKALLRQPRHLCNLESALLARSRVRPRSFCFRVSMIPAGLLVGFVTQAPPKCRGLECTEPCAQFDGRLWNQRLEKKKEELGHCALQCSAQSRPASSSGTRSRPRSRTRGRQGSPLDNDDVTDQTERGMSCGDFSPTASRPLPAASSHSTDPAPCTRPPPW